MKKSIASFLTLLMVMTPHTWGDRKHEDVEDIGNRKINGRVLGIFPNFVSLGREIQLGAQMAQQLEQTARFVEDPIVVEYVDGLAQEIVKHSDAKVPFVVRVLDTDEVNAFALPGGYFYVNKGLILEADTESELAGVLAHEISHVTARHATERMTKGQLLQFAAIPALFVGGYWAQYGIRQGLGLGLSLAVLGITRKSEEEADQLGVQYTWNTGIDPNGFITFFEKLQAKQKDKPSKFASFFRTHPPVEDRISKVQEEMSYLPRKDQYRVNTTGFDKIKSRLIAADNKRAIPGSRSGDVKRPTLKRKTRTSRNDTGTSTSKKSRPTLKRNRDLDN